ncbi:MAG: polysaccharide deacetylase family protein [Phycisphaerae bacterium]
MTLLDVQPVARPVARPVSPLAIARPRPVAAPRRVLFVTSRFPPVASVGAVRVRKFCRYLARHGWQPVVLTGPLAPPGRADGEASATTRDLDSLAEIPPEIIVQRFAGRLESGPAELVAAWAERLGRATDWMGLDARRWADGLGWRALRLWQRLCWPDAGIWRVPAAVAAAARLHRDQPFDAIYSSAMPFSDHLAALAIAWRLGLPWVADFRDPWVEYVHWNASGGRVGRWLARRCEAAIVRRAAAVVSIGERMTRQFRRRYPRRADERFVTIRNGYDPADFSTAPPTIEPDTLRLLYCGSLYGGRDPRPLIEGFAALPADAGPVRLEFAGRLGPHADAVRQAAQRGAVVSHGLVSHGDAMALMQACTVMVILQSDAAGTDIDISAKTYEYLGSGKPILALLPADCEAAELLRTFDGVWIAPPRDAPAIGAALREIAARWRGGRLHPRRTAAALAPLTRQTQARQLAATLDEVAGGPRVGAVRRAAGRLGAALRRARPAECVTILAYHRVSDEPSDLVDAPGLTHTPREFERQMAWLARHFRPARLSDVVAAFERGRPPRRAAVVTFDDGFADTLRVAAPIARRYGVPITVALTTSVVGNGDLLWRHKLAWLLASPRSAAAEAAIRALYREYDLAPQAAESIADLTRRVFLPDRLPALLDRLLRDAGTSGAGLAAERAAYVTPAEIAAADRAWVEFANHTHTHPVLSALSKERQLEEFETAAQLIARWCGARPATLVVPFGLRADYSPATAAAARDTGHRAVLDLRRRSNGLRTSPWELSRRPAPAGDLAEFERAYTAGDAAGDSVVARRDDGDGLADRAAAVRGRVRLGADDLAGARAGGSARRHPGRVTVCCGRAAGGCTSSRRVIRGGLSRCRSTICRASRARSSARRCRPGGASPTNRCAAIWPRWSGPA